MSRFYLNTLNTSYGQKEITSFQAVIPNKLTGDNYLDPGSAISDTLEFMKYAAPVEEVSDATIDGNINGPWEYGIPIKRIIDGCKMKVK